MPKVQVVNIKNMEGIAKASQRPYKMLIVGCLFTGDDGVIQMGDISFLDRPDRPLPTNLKPGSTYIPAIGASSRDGKLSFQITELVPIDASASVKAA